MRVGSYDPIFRGTAQPTREEGFSGFLGIDLHQAANMHSFDRVSRNGANFAVRQERFVESFTEMIG
jgi:hypothetical protein